VKQVKVLGENFFNTNEIKCIFNDLYQVTPIYKSNNEMWCPLSSVPALTPTTSLHISNDNGKTVSNEYDLEIKSILPYLYTLE